MPGNSNDSGSCTLSSGLSRRSKGRKYHTVSDTSQVDESLFGVRLKQRTEMLEEKQTENANNNHPNDCPCPRIEDEARKRKKKEVVQVVTKDLVRNLRVPYEDPSGKAIILLRSELEEIREAAKVITAEEKYQMDEEWRKRKDEMVNELMERKDYMKKLDMERNNNAQFTDIEMEQFLRHEELKRMAIEKKQEQEDEIIKLNKLIMDAKCKAIQDAQILEQDKIKKEKKEEESRLDRMMEIDRVKGIGADEELQRKRKEERMLGAMKIIDQIKENSDEKLLELEQKDQEAILMKKYIEKLCEEEIEEIKEKRKNQRKLREELDQCIDDIVRREEMKLLQNRTVENKALEHQREKDEREAAWEKEQERERIIRAKEIDRLRSLQERAIDAQEERDALRAKRVQEQADRDWRRKELHDAAVKAEKLVMMQKAREKQLAEKLHFKAVAAHRERSEFERLLNVQKDLIQRDREGEHSRYSKNRKYADDVRNQIKTKEKNKIEERNAHFEEGVKLEEEARNRQLQIEMVKRKKLDQLRATGLDERYLTTIKRKVMAPPHVVEQMQRMTGKAGS